MGSQLRDNPNQCPICKCTSLSAELGPTPAKTTLRRTTVTAPPSAAAAKPVKPARTETATPIKPVARTSSVRRGVDWRVVGVAGAGAAFVMGCAILAIAAHGSRQQSANVAVEEVPVAQIEAPVVPVEIKPEPAPVPVATKTETPIVPMPPAEEAKPEVKPARNRPQEETLVFKHRSKQSDEALRRELLLIPEMGVKDIPQSGGRRWPTRPRTARSSPAKCPTSRACPCVWASIVRSATKRRRPCSAVPQARIAMFNATPRDGVDTRPDVDLLRSALRGKEWTQPEAIATLTQMLMPEGRQLRLLMVELLQRISGPRASAALAQRAVFDLSDDRRAAAVAALRDRPAEDYRAALMQGFRYPWVPAADHAAEAVVALEDLASLPELLRVLREPDPSGAFRDSSGEPVVREMVRINHLANCTLCHASSPNAHELVRGRVPSPTEPRRRRSSITARASASSSGRTSPICSRISVPQPVTARPLADPPAL